MWHELAVAVALLFIIEGIFPFISPNGMRRALQVISQMPDQPLRLAGLTSMLLGLALLYLIN